MDSRLQVPIEGPVFVEASKFHGVVICLRRPWGQRGVGISQEDFLEEEGSTLGPKGREAG